MGGAGFVSSEGESAGLEDRQDTMAREVTDVGGCQSILSGDGDKGQPRLPERK